MNWDVIEGNWSQFKGEMRDKWGKLTDNDWEQMNGKKEKFFGAMHEKYGYKKEELSKELDRFLEKWKPKATSDSKVGTSSK